MNENEKKKVSLLDRYIKYWYGISGPLDEYKKAKIDQIGNKAFFIAMLTMISLFLISSIVYTYLGSEIAYYTLCIGGFLVLIVVSSFVMSKTNKIHLTDNEVEEKDLPQAKKAARVRGAFSGLYFGIAMFLIEFVTSGMDKKMFLIDFIFYLVLGAIAFGGIMAMFYSSRIKVVKDEEN